MRERADERAAKYLDSISKQLKSVKINETRPEPSSHLDQVLSLTRDYTRDAKHYLDTKKPVTALACVAYAEGLLDALKFLCLVES